MAVLNLRLFCDEGIVEISGVPMLCGRRTTRTRVDRRFEGAVLEDALADVPGEGRGWVEGCSLFAMTSVA